MNYIFLFSYCAAMSELLVKYVKLFNSAITYYLERKKYDEATLNNPDKNNPNVMKNRKQYELFLYQFLNTKIFFHYCFCIIDCGLDNHIVVDYNIRDISNLFGYMSGGHGVWLNRQTQMEALSHGIKAYVQQEGIKIDKKYLRLSDLVYMDSAGNIKLSVENPKLVGYNGEIYSIQQQKLIKSPLTFKRNTKTFLKYPALFGKLFDAETENDVFQFCCAYMAIYFLKIQPIKLYLSGFDHYQLKFILDTFYDSLGLIHSCEKRIFGYEYEYGFDYMKHEPIKLLIISNNKASVRRIKYRKSETSFIFQDQAGEFNLNGNLCEDIKTSIIMKIYPIYKSFGKLRTNDNDYDEIRNYLLDCVLLLWREYGLV